MVLINMGMIGSPGEVIQLLLRNLYQGSTMVGEVQMCGVIYFTLNQL